MKRKLLFSALLLLIAEGRALTVGQIRLSSYLSEPLRAEVPLLLEPGEDPDAIRVELASPAEYARFGLSYDPILETLVVDPVVRDDGRVVVRIASRLPVKSPVLDLLLRIETPEGRLLRQFTLFLDPPQLARSEPSEVAQVPAEPEPVPPPRETPSRPERYRVGRGETLFGIAAKLTPPGATPYQTALALYRANPGAFIGGNPNLIRAGALLEVPDPEAVRAISPAEARREFWRHLAATRQEPSPARVAEAPRLKLELPKEGAPGGEAETTPAQQPSPEQQARLLLPLKRRIEALERELEQADEELALAALELAYREAPKAAPPKEAAPKPAEKPRPVVVARPKPEPSKPEEPGAAEETLRSTADFLVDHRASIMAASLMLLFLATFLAVQRARRQREVEEILEEPEGEAALAITDTEEELPSEAPEEIAIQEETQEAPGEEAAEVKAPEKEKEEKGAELELDWLKDFDLGEELALDFDLTGGEGAEVIDPLTEADVYLTYFQYDKAEEIIRKALEQEPGRSDLQFKLLEIYYNKADAENFEKHAMVFAKQGLASDPSVWSRVVEMGQALCPKSPLFKEAPPKEEAVASEPPQEEAPSEEEELLRFSPEELGLPEVEEAPPKKEAPATEAEEAPEKPKVAEPPKEEPPAEQKAPPASELQEEATSKEEELLSFSPEALDLPEAEEGPPKEGTPATEAEAPPEEPIPFVKEEETAAPKEPLPSQEGQAETAMSSQEEENERIQLEVARTYLELGRRDEARAILEELYLRGSSRIRSEVRPLLAQLEEE